MRTMMMVKCLPGTLGPTTDEVYFIISVSGGNRTPINGESLEWPNMFKIHSLFLDNKIFYSNLTNPDAAFM